MNVREGSGAAGQQLWFNPAVGVAGDMVIAALLDVGADEDHVHAQLAALELPGWELGVAATVRGALRATSVVVVHGETHHHRSWSTIDALLASAPLSAPVAEGARATFRELAVAEASVHGVDIDDVHFHEVGAIDAIVDIVGAWAALDSLGVDLVVSGAIGIGTAVVEMAHGAVPVPAPATLELLVGLPTVPVEGAGETATPTGVALLRTMVDRWGPMPTGTVLGSGRGAGTWDPPTHANVLTAVRSEQSGPTVHTDPAHTDPAHTYPAHTGVDVPHAAVVIETNVDDVTPEVLGHVVEQLLHGGADDAWVTPITMKKGRPAHLIGALCRPERADALRALLAAETGTLGLRQTTVEKFEFSRHVDQVEVHGHVVAMKVGPHGAKPEHDDVVTVAARTGLPARTVARDAVTAWSHRDDTRSAT